MWLSPHYKGLRHQPSKVVLIPLRFFPTSFHTSAVAFFSNPCLSIFVNYRRISSINTSLESFIKMEVSRKKSFPAFQGAWILMRSAAVSTPTHLVSGYVKDIFIFFCLVVFVGLLQDPDIDTSVSSVDLHVKSRGWFNGVISLTRPRRLT